jgi:putative transposase
MTTGGIANHLADIYGTDVSRDLVSRVTNAVIEDMQQWKSRPLDSCYPVVLIDAIVLKICDGQVRNRPVYVAMGITIDGDYDVLGLWAGPGRRRGGIWNGHRSVPADSYCCVRFPTDRRVADIQGVSL